MTLIQLTYFLEAARQQHIGKASKILAISPSAISHAIAGLEDELGRTLFDKRGKNIYLTVHGKTLMEKADSLLQRVSSIKDEVASDAVDLQGHYKIAATHLLVSRLVTSVWEKTHNGCGSISCELYSLRSAQVVSGILGGEFDLGFCYSPQGQAGFESLKIFEGQLVTVARKNHPVFKLKPAARLKALNEFKAVLPKAFQGIEVCEQHPMFKKYGIKPSADFICDSYDVHLEKVERSDSWGLVPDHLLKFWRDRVRVIHLPADWDAPFHVSAVWPKNRPPTRFLRKLIEALRVELHSTSLNIGSAEAVRERPLDC